jgi:hypothetical protein
MKLSYDIIKANLEAYEEAKKKIPAISQYEAGDVSSSAMRSLNLLKFADFYDFLKSVKNTGFDIIMPDMNWRKLKPILIEKTTNIRLRKFISNRTQNQFQSLLKDAETYDRLLNGRWVRKPKFTRRGRLGSGLRSDEYISGLVGGLIPIINYVIQNDIEVFESVKSGCVDIPSFISQDKNVHFLKWFTYEKLTLSTVPVREIEVTNKLISSFVEIIENSKIDPRKLNLDYVTTTISERLKKGMIVPDHTNLRCIRDVIDGMNRKIFTKDQVYSSQGSYISNGGVMVYLKNDLNHRSYVKYEDFEDMSIHRDDLLSSLFGG